MVKNLSKHFKNLEHGTKNEVSIRISSVNVKFTEEILWKISCFVQWTNEIYS